MECVQRRTIDHGRLMAEHHLLAIFKAVQDDRSSVAQPDLEHGLLVLPPPSLKHPARQQNIRDVDYVMGHSHLAHGSVVIAELEKVPDYGQCTRYLRNTLDLWDVGGCQALYSSSVSIFCEASGYAMPSTHQEDHIKQDRTQSER